MTQILWYNLSFEEVVKKLNSDPEKGLSEKEVKSRQEKFGKNLIPEQLPFSSLRLFLEQFKSPLIYILIIAGIVTLALKAWTDAIVIFLAIFINALFGFWQERKTSKILEKLKKVLKTKATVLREGQKMEIFQEELLPGDIIYLKAGDKVPADGRLIEAENLKISEAVLTGEWIPSQKTTKILPKETPLADRENMVYMGSLVEAGFGKAICTETGERTEAGKIALLVQKTKEEKTPLQRKLTGFGKIIGILIGVICFFIFVGGLLREGDPLEMFEASVAIAVGGTPEALPIMMTIILTVGMERILRKKGLVRKLSSVETLGSTQIICFDKTKTLTQGKMELAKIVSEDENLALKIAVLCNEGFIENPKDSKENWKIRGSPTDKALLKAGIERGLLKPELEKKSLEKYFLYVVGAPERILEKSLNKEGWLEKLESLTEKGLRVIGVGYKEISNLKFQGVPKSAKQVWGRIQTSNLPNLNELANDFNFVGLIALKDPLRPEVKEAIEICKKAGMKPILVTGDHKLTAIAVAKEVGFKVSEENILEGKDLDRLSDGELEKILEKIQIFARVEPKHKMRIIRAWQEKGKVVAMTGDGVNDAPALKKADIGIALGSGTEVAKESSDLVLLNDSFSIIIKAIEQGRVILDNLRKSISYILADSFTSVILIGFAKIIFGWPLPILPVQILWNNFVEDTLPDIAFAFEPKEKGIMKRKPVPAKAPLLTKEMKILIFTTGLIDEFLMLILFWYLWGKLGLNLDYVRTVIFGTVCIDTAFVVYCYKSLRKNIWQINPFSNKWLVISSIVVFLAFALAVYFPPLQSLLHTVPLGIGSWLILIGIGILSMVLIEITKWYFISRKETAV